MAPADLVVGDKTFVAQREVVLSQNSGNRNDQVEQPQIISTGRPDKGSPDDKALLDLARTYLEIQHRLWPALVVCKLLPAIGEAEIEELAAAFRERFLSGKVGRFQPEVDESATIALDILNKRREVLEHMTKDLLEIEVMDADHLKRILDEHKTGPQLVPGTFAQTNTNPPAEAASPGLRESAE